MSHGAHVLMVLLLGQFLFGGLGSMPPGALSPGQPAAQAASGPAPSLPAPSPNAYCGPGNVASFGNTDGPAALPRTCYYTALSATPSPGKIITVSSGASVATALNNAACGDTVALQAGGTFSRFTVPAKGCDANHYITIRTSAPDASLPPEGARITPCYAGVASLPGRPAYACAQPSHALAQVISRDSTPAIQFAPGANYYRFIGLEVTRKQGTGINYNLVAPSGFSNTSTSSVMDHIIFDRMWFHGTPLDETTRGLLLVAASHVAVIDSYFNDFHCTAVTGACVDAQAIAGGFGSAPMATWKIVNNFLEGAAETILFGGARATATPNDIEIRHNTFFKPLTWDPNNANFIGTKFIVKNLFELKNANRLLLEGNVMQNTWGGFSQVGDAILLTPRNTVSVTNVTIRYNTVSHAGGGLQLADPTGGYAGNGWSVHDVVFDDLAYPSCYGCGNYANEIGTSGDANPPAPTDRLHDLTVNHITEVLNSSHIPTNMLVMTGPTAADPPQMSNIVITNAILAAGNNAVGGGGAGNCAVYAGPKPDFDACWVPYVFAGNAIVGGGSNRAWVWPAGNFFPAAYQTVGFVNLNGGVGGDYHLSASSPYRRAGTDGGDIGANIDAVNAVTAGAVAGVWNGDPTCGPPVYCARRDTQLVPYTATPPVLGPAGSIIRDPNFGERILRVSDPSTWSAHPGSGFAADGSAEAEAWNASTTMFMFHAAEHGRLFIYAFDSATMTAKPTGVTPPVGGEFSHVNPNLVLGWGGAQGHLKVQAYNISTNATTTLSDPAACPGVQESSNAYGMDAGVSAGDTRIMGVFGPQQDADAYVYVYDQTLGCRWYNTITGQVGGQWGPAGTVSTGSRFLIHNARISKSGDVIAVTPSVGATNVMMWNVGTLTVTPCTVQCGGHRAMGYTHLVNTGWLDDMNIVDRPLGSLSAFWSLIPNRPAPVEWGLDKHLSWNYINPSDTTPACLSTYAATNPNTPGVPLVTRRAWDNEVLCVRTDGTQTVWRFAHTYSTARNGFWSTPRGNVSQDGRFYMWTSDWQDSLGTADTGGYREDVFIVELK